MKTKKSNLAIELKNLLLDVLPTSLSPADNNRALILDFMGYVREVPVKKQNLKTYRDFFVSLWNTFKSLGNTCQRIDIVFDLYKEQSIKASERNRRATVAGIETYITNVDQSLPIEMDRFWSVGKNKVAFQRLFIKWMMQDQSRNESNKTIFLGGSHREGDHLCFSVTDGNVSLEHLLECSHEEADDRVLFHASHAVKCGHFKSVAIASPDVDIFVNSTHHYNKLIHNDLEDLWMICGRSSSRVCVPIHDLVCIAGSDLVEVLPASHSLSGCDSASKVATKGKAMRVAQTSEGHSLLYRFGRDEISEEMIEDAEKFLLLCVTKHNVDTFDELRFIVFHEKFQEFDIEKFPPTSASIRQHILRAYLQCYIWLHAPFVQNIELDPLDYGYTLDDDGNLLPTLSTELPIPDDFPSPCHCLKCATKVCPCRIREIQCCQYCKCCAGNECRNPFHSIGE